MGRQTYDQSLGFEEYPYKGKQAFVFTHNAKRASGQNAELISSDIAGFVRKLARLKGKDIWLVGGADFVTSLSAGLVDRIILSAHLTILRKGVHLFKDMGREVKMKLIRSISYESGLVQLHYDL
jgi:dihydrofolate reductase